MTAKLNAAKQMPTPTAAKMKTSTPDILLVFFVYGLRARSGLAVCKTAGAVGSSAFREFCGRGRRGRGDGVRAAHAWAPVPSDARAARRGEADIQLGGPGWARVAGVLHQSRSAAGPPFKNVYRGAAADLNYTRAARQRVDSRSQFL